MVEKRTRSKLTSVDSDLSEGHLPHLRIAIFDFEQKS